MRIEMIVADITAITVIIGAANSVIPAIAGVLAAIWYGFMVYDRIKYGPEQDGRLWGNKHDTKE
jgi:hypothetical protein